MSIANLEVPNNYNLYCNALQYGDGGSFFQLYTETGYSTNITGPFSGSNIGLFRQIDRVSMISLNGTTGTSTTSAPISFSTLSLSPAYAILYFPIWVVDNGSNVMGTLKIDTNGQITIYKNFSDSFTGSGTCGFQSFSICYCVYI